MSTVFYYIFCVGYITAAFPWLFPYGIADFNSDGRYAPVSLAEYFKHLMLFEDCRFQRDSRFPYFALNTMLRREANSLGSVYVKQNPLDAHLTADELLHMSKKGKKQLLTRIRRFGNKVAGSNAFWKTRLSELRMMIEQMKTFPTFFFTFSAADLKWPEIAALLKEYEGSRLKAVNANPAMCDQHFQDRLDALMKTMFARINVKVWCYLLNYTFE